MYVGFAVRTQSLLQGDQPHYALEAFSIADDGDRDLDDDYRDLPLVRRVWQQDTFVARWRDRSLHADAYVTFSLEPDGTIERMKMMPVSPLTDFSFDFQDLLFTPAPKN